MSLFLRILFLYQNKKYRKCEYADNIKYVLTQKEKIRTILDKHREEKLPEDWIPLSVYCEKCNTDETKIIDYDERYTITYSCKCGHENTIDFRKKGIVKLPWRLDWPMRWYHEKVNFEPYDRNAQRAFKEFLPQMLLLKQKEVNFVRRRFFE